METVIGIDLDNTIISFDRILHASASELGLVGRGIPVRKDAVKQAILERHGDRVWHHIQKIAYGLRMEEARLIRGAVPFISECLRSGIRVYIISHKAELVEVNGVRINLRNKAMQFLKKRFIIGSETDRLNEQNIFFEPTRADKLARIAKLRCTHFIDDLEDVFREDGFPETVTKILLGHTTDSSWMTCPTWGKVSQYFFG
ncbi:hypothetical protein A2Z33_04075 [Candidatus Gottesmanbacteria bacterium RBG_16_52_11]|uniref:Haloacid dehalogenase-like hydrolase n=1 Tax=Candidatus Gottesmanbacteria bacterium RBG_16_52_11 TaxID=1798374 RepID=A0A1F5YVT2_9BACT|nr:MAG: hypothetical protein A2Z33_04075 [Candidatus Gottesmanbacteria bacterium RBG_16_52_11]